MQTLSLNDGVQIPTVGFGTWKLTGLVCQRAVQKALKVGYRHIDTADIYGNHRDISKILQESGVRRDELFITTKVWHDKLRTRDVFESVKRFQDELRTTYFDLLLIHWPNHTIPVKETLTAFEQLKQDHLIRSYGVSNFTIHHLQDVLQAGFRPTVNQVEFHPSLNQRDLKNFCDQNNIAITAYSPLGQGFDIKLPVVRELAYKYNTTPSQVILNWLIQKNIIVIPKSSSAFHIEDNFKANSWHLDPADAELIERVRDNRRLVDQEFGEFEY